MMNQEDLFKKLGLILNELNEQYQFLAENPQQLSELELELFHANANFLADHVQIIKKINLNNLQPIAINPVGEQPVEEEPTPLAIADQEEEDQVEEVTFADEFQVENQSGATPTIPADLAEEPGPAIETFNDEIFKLDQTPSTFEFILNDHAEHETIESIPQADDNYAQDSFITHENSLADEKFDFEEKSVDEIFNRPLSEEEERILAQKRKLREQAAQEAPVVEEDEIGPEPFLVHKVEEDFPTVEPELELEEAPISKIEVNKKEPVEDPTYKPTLNDLLAKSTQGNINSTSNIALADLKQGINLNDKLLYIKDLFNGYNLAYAEAIDLANKLPNFEAADNFFQKNYAIKNNWAEKQGTVDQFYELLNRRFKKS